MDFDRSARTRVFFVFSPDRPQGEGQRDNSSKLFKAGEISKAKSHLCAMAGFYGYLKIFICSSSC